MQVMDCDRYSQNDTMGEVSINIDEMDLTKSVEVQKFLKFMPFAVHNFFFSKLGRFGLN